MGHPLIFDEFSNEHTCSAGSRGKSLFGVFFFGTIIFGLGGGSKIWYPKGNLLATSHASGFWVVGIWLRFHGVLFPDGMPKGSQGVRVFGIFGYGVVLFHEKS